MVKEIREKLERAIKDAYLNRDAVNILVGAMDEAIGELKEYEDRPRKLCEQGFHLYYQLCIIGEDENLGSMIYPTKQQALKAFEYYALNEPELTIREIWMKPL